MPEATSLKIDNTTEIVSASQAKWLLRRYSKGCTPDCLACHFSEFFVRDLHPDDIERLLEGEYQITELPSYGFQTVAMGSTQGFQDRHIPDGIYSHLISLHRRNEALTRENCLTVRDISLMIGARWGLQLTPSQTCDIVDHWMDSLPRDEEGYPQMPPFIDEAPHPGRHLDRLATRPLTPLNGRPRSSFSRPPPQYSPRPSFRGRTLRHPREVIPEDGHQAPFYPSHQTPAPPTYEGSGSEPPPYSPIRRASNIRRSTSDANNGFPSSSARRRASQVSRRGSQASLARRRHARVPPRLQREDAFVARGSRGSSGSMNETTEGYLNWLSRQTTTILESPGDVASRPSLRRTADGRTSWLDLFDGGRITEEPQTNPPTLASSQFGFAQSTFPQTFLDMSPDSPSTVEAQVTAESSNTETSSSGPDSDTSTQRAARDEPDWPFAFIPEMSHGSLATSPYVTIIPVRYTPPNEEEGVYFVYHPLTVAELEDAAADIEHLKNTFGTTFDDDISASRAQADNPSAATCLRDPVLTLPLHDGNDVLQLAQHPIDEFKLDTEDHVRQIQFFVHQAFEEMLSNESFVAKFLGETDEYEEWDVNTLRKMMMISKIEREARKHDRATEASTVLVRERLAAAMELDISTVLVPYDLDAHISAGNITHEHDWLRTDEQFLIQLRLHQLPDDLQIWTENAAPSRIPHPDPDLNARLAHNPAYELPSQHITEPYKQLSETQQCLIMQDLVYEIANEIAHVHQDNYLRALATAFLTPETPLSLDVLRGVLAAVRSVRAMQIPIETVSAVFGADESCGLLGDVFGVTSTGREETQAAHAAAGAVTPAPQESRSSSTSSDASTSTAGSDDHGGVALSSYPPSSPATSVASADDSFEHHTTPLPAPRPNDVLPFPQADSVLGILRHQYPDIFSAVVAHFPSTTTTVWTRSMAARLARALEIAQLRHRTEEVDQEVRTVLDATVGKMREVLRGWREMGEDADADADGVGRSDEEVLSRVQDRVGRQEGDRGRGVEWLVGLGEAEVLRELRNGTFGRFVQSWRDAVVEVGLEEEQRVRLSVRLFGEPVLRALEWCVRSIEAGGFAEGKWLGAREAERLLDVVEAVTAWLEGEEDGEGDATVAAGDGALVFDIDAFNAEWERERPRLQAEREAVNAARARAVAEREEGPGASFYSGFDGVL